MINWRQLVKLIDDNTEVEVLKDKAGTYGIYPCSIRKKEGSILFMVKQEKDKKLVVIGESEIYEKFEGNEEYIGDKKLKVCETSHKNCIILREIFPFANPSAVLSYDKTIGLGDRLGPATGGHIQLIKEYDVRPVLAQQSIRELNLTGRAYVDVLDDASWAVYQEGYTKGFGADGDHLKNPEEVLMALDCGFTMITLDCSEHINNDVTHMDKGKISSIYDSLDENARNEWENNYLDKQFDLGEDHKIEFKEEDLKETVLIYKDAIHFAADIYSKYIKGYERDVDFEMSIDETLTPTSPQAHFFVASELIKAGVKPATIAPKFCGEFQKGIDYIGSIEQFEKEFKIHAAIAEHFNYKISVHSGSDKFRVFPIVGKETKGLYHVKTAGTNWLEAIRVIALKRPGLYREIHKYALTVLDEAKKYYHITAEMNKVPDIDSLKDEQLPELMDKNDSRQLIHITYGLILQAKSPDGSFLFRDRIYESMHKYENDYHSALYKHIGRHLSELGNSKIV